MAALILLLVSLARDIWMAPLAKALPQGGGTSIPTGNWLSLNGLWHVGVGWALSQYSFDSSRMVRGKGETTSKRLDSRRSQC